MEEAATILFSKNWEIYQKIISANYMLHHEFGNFTRNILDAAIQKEQVKFLDLGCGDASHLATHLAEMKLASYTGFDMSKHALTLAGNNIKKISSNIILQEGDMQDLLEKDPNHYSIIYSSYSIHHLQSDNKIKIFQEIYNRITATGSFIYIDIYRQNAQTRESYMSDYKDLMYGKWDSLLDDEKEMVLSHLQQYDFPEEITTTINRLTEIGFQVEIISQEDTKHMMLLCSK